MEQMHLWLDMLCDISILLFEFVGVIILVMAGIKGVYHYIKKHPLTRL